MKRVREAFTLVELLVVIGIIAILMGILIPAVSKARQQGMDVTCAKTLQQLGVLLNQYAVEFKGQLPYARYVSVAVANGPAPTGANTRGLDSGQDNQNNRATIVWWSALRKYMKSRGTGNWDNATSSQSERFMAAFSCPFGRNRDGGNDFSTNPVVMIDSLWEGSRDGPNSIANWSPMIGAQMHLRLRKSANVKQLLPDTAVLWDACEIPPLYNTQYTCSYGVDAGLPASGHLYPNHRWRGGPEANDPQYGENTLIDPGPNTDQGVTEDTVYSDANIRWRHRKDKYANFLMGDWTVRMMRITETAVDQKQKGEVYRKMLRPKKPSYINYF